MTDKDSAVHDNIKLRTQMKVAKVNKKDMRQLKRGRVLTGAEILAGIESRTVKKEPGAVKKGLAAKKEHGQSKRKTAPPKASSKQVPVIPKRVQVRF
jgi:hypothetical protein